MADAYTAEDVWSDLVERFDVRDPDYRKFHQYWKAEQPLAIDPKELRSRFGSTMAEFRDNLARPVIESAESRVRIKEFPSAAATDLWNRLDMPAKHRLVHTEALVKGDAFVIVLPDEDGDARIWTQSSEDCAVVYNFEDPDLAIAGMKRWVEVLQKPDDIKPKEYVRVNLYFADRIERLVSMHSGREFESDLNKYESFDFDGKPWTQRHSLGEVPMYELNASYDLTDMRGRSDLADATSLIDAINKTFLDMLTASEFTAAPQRWATGVEIPLDPKTGEPMETFTAGTHKLWTAPSETAKFGQFAPGDLKGYRDAIDTLVDHLAFVTRTPSYALMKQVQYPSGPALQSAEQPLRQRVGDHQTDFSPFWRKVMAAVLKVEGDEVGEDALDELMPRWLPVNAPFSTMELLEELKVHVEVLGVPEEMAWRRAGYTKTEIEEMKQMREDQALLGEDALALAQAQTLLNPAQPEAGLTQDGLIEPAAPEAEPDLTPATGPPQ